MANVYSQLLFFRQATVTTSEDSNPVPTGFVWVVRSVSVLSPGQPFSTEFGWALSATNGAVLCGVASGYGAGSTHYAFDLHQVVETGGVLHFGSSVPGYGLTVSGYQLTLP